ncbi:MAG: hypothetical protein JWO56_2167, partial [Acidobacteria bacterium]|nr:hypothetical protein [Acidobacteriota bacterium]
FAKQKSQLLGVRPGPGLWLFLETANIEGLIPAQTAQTTNATAGVVGPGLGLSPKLR